MSAFPIIPRDDVVVAQQIVEEVTTGGIILPGEEGKLRYARVLAVGPGKYFASAANARGSIEVAVFVPTTTKVGDVIVFGKYQSAGEPIKFDGEEYLLFREGDIVGTLEPSRAERMFAKLKEAA